MRAAFLVLAIVAALLVERQEARKSTTWPVARSVPGPAPSVSSTVVRSSRAEAIWLASARLKISS